jgi:trans-aconitate methyltransferase
LKPRDPEEVLIVATARPGRRLDEIAAEASSLDEQAWSEAAVAQLIAAAAAADRWLVEHPDDAGRLLEDPVGVIAAMSEAGVLAEPVDDLLEALRSRPRAARSRPEGAVRFAVKPMLRSKARPYPEQHRDR